MGFCVLGYISFCFVFDVWSVVSSILGDGVMCLFNLSLLIIMYFVSVFVLMIFIVFRMVSVIGRL